MKISLKEAIKRVKGDTVIFFGAATHISEVSIEDSDFGEIVESPYEEDEICLMYISDEKRGGGKAAVLTFEVV